MATLNLSEENCLTVENRTLNGVVERPSIIILGNSGVGKSFLANVLIGEEVFQHRFSSTSVTTKTECVQAQINDSLFTIFNLPGLIEAEQERINLNKAEIDKAFLEQSNSIIIFVFGHQHGRIREEDILTFNVINAAYSFRPESLAIVINGLTSDRADTYEGTALVLLQRLLKDVCIFDSNICFLDQVNVNDVIEMETLKKRLLKAVNKCKPMPHKKIQEIETRIDQLKHAQNQIRENQTSFEIERTQFLETIKEKQNRIRETVYQHRDEKEFSPGVDEQQQVHLAEQNRQINESRKSFELKMLEMQMELKQAREAYEQLRNNQLSPPEAVQHSRSVLDDLKKVFTELIVGGFIRSICVDFLLPNARR